MISIYRRRPSQEKATALTPSLPTMSSSAPQHRQRSHLIPKTKSNSQHCWIKQEHHPAMVRTTTLLLPIAGYPGLMPPSTAPITGNGITVTVNAAPVIGRTGGTLAFTEGDGATVIDSSLTITDADETNIESATVTISSGFQSSEDVPATDANGITGSWRYTTGVLTLTGSATLANYKAALESVTFNNISDNPTLQTAPSHGR